MKPLRHRQELFCRRFVECANATIAAKSAGYAPGSARNAGYRLLRRPAITARVAALHREMARQNCRDVDVLIGKLEAIYRRAIDAQQCSAAARVVELQAKLAAGGLAVSGGGKARLPAGAKIEIPPLANDSTN